MRVELSITFCSTSLMVFISGVLERGSATWTMHQSFPTTRCPHEPFPLFFEISDHVLNRTERLLLGLSLRHCLLVLRDNLLAIDDLWVDVDGFPILTFDSARLASAQGALAARPTLMLSSGRHTLLSSLLLFQLESFFPVLFLGVLEILDLLLHRDYLRHWTCFSILLSLVQVHQLRHLLFELFHFLVFRFLHSHHALVVPLLLLETTECFLKHADLT